MVRALAIVACLVAPAVAHAQDGADLLKQLNGTLAKASADKLSWKPVLEAWAAMPAPPCAADAGCGQDSIWPGMKDWSKFADWAKANPGMGKALIQAQSALAWGMPYGDSALPAALKGKGVAVMLGDGDQLVNMKVGYLAALRTIGQYVTAEQYRLCDDGKFKEGFELGVAHLRLLRQVCDQSLLAEKLFGMEQLSQALSIQRDMLWRYRDKAPATALREVALKGYPFLGTGDSERMRRLLLPEGDRLVVAAQLSRGFDAAGQPDAERFASVFGADPNHSSPMQRFGEEKMWKRVAEVHGSLDASEEKLQAIYDDWWRRWRMRPYGNPIFELPTETSRLNPVKYAAVSKLLQDLTKAFDARNVLIANANGTAFAAAVVARYRADQGRWPQKLEIAIQADYMKTKMNLDPFDKGYKGFEYRAVTKPKAVDAAVGRIEAPGVLIFAKGIDHESNEAATHTDDGSKGDILIWPPVRELAREQGLLGS
jgi:hypothetical protein